ncbi:TauD/TfdA dioxygenase family protein [Nocardia thailandica]
MDQAVGPVTMVVAERVSAESAITVVPRSRCIGAEISGVDIAADNSDRVIEEIRRAVLRWKVVFFRGQRIDHAGQIAFAGRFGRVIPAHPREDGSPAGFPEILAIGGHRYGELYGRARGGHDSDWHSEVSALVNPPALAVLRADAGGQAGGVTAWTNLVAAYENLPAELRAVAEVVDAEHAFGGRVRRGAGVGAEVAARSVHPVVRVHPETGERALFVSPGFTRAARKLRNLGAELSSVLLEALWAEATRAEHTVRIGWEPGTVVLWDNRATARLPIPDAGSDGVLYRVLTEGDLPRGIDGRVSESVPDGPVRGWSPDIVRAAG